ncbi:MAG: hypothetical protein O7G85_03680, partial [Planctomycetota bacterium]|nr:hypothetical protein [Planctomycetota bacterium]
WYNPPGAWHAVRNQGDTPLVMVFTTIPNEKMGLLSFFRKIGVAPGESAVTISPEEIERLGLAHDLILYTSEEAEAAGHHGDKEHETKEGNPDHEQR